MRATVLVVAVALACLVAGCGAATEDPRDVFTADRTVELARAVSAGDRDRIDDLIDRGAKVEDRGTDGTSLLQWAVENRSLAGLEALLDHDADPEQEGRKDEPAPYSTAAWEADPRFLQTLLDAGADPDVRYRETGSTPIFGAALNGHRVNVLNDRARTERKEIIDWLEDNDVPVVADADQFR